MPGPWNEPSLAATVWGSSSWLVHVTVVPTGTVSVAGSNLKSLIFTAFGPTGAAGAVVDEPVAAGALPVGGIALIPGIPGVALTPDPKVTDAGAFDDGAVGAGDEQLASSRTAAVAAGAPPQLMFTPVNRTPGYTGLRSAARVSGRAPRSRR